MQKETQVSLINKLQKDVIPGINLFEAVLFSTTTLLGIVLFILSIVGNVNNFEKNWENIVSNVLMLIDIPLGVIAATFLSKRSKIAPILLATDAILYGSANLLNAHYALGLVNIIVIPLILLSSFFFTWNKEEGKEVETYKLDILTGAILVSGILITSMLMGLFLPLIFYKPIEASTMPEWLKQYNIWFDSFAASLMIFATIGSVLRYRETWILYMTSNVMKIFLFVVLLATGQGADGMLLLLASAYFINTIFGFIVWSKGKEVSSEDNN